MIVYMDPGAPTCNTFSKALAGEIRASLARKDSTQGALSKATGISGPTLSRRLSGDSPFDVLELARVAEFLGTSTSELLKLAEAQMPSEVAAS